MGITASMFFIAAGAIMRFAVTAQAKGFSVHMVGVILMIVGAAGAVLSIAYWASWGGFRRRTVVTSTQAPDERNSTVAR